MTVSIEDQIKSVAREIAMRKNVYPKWVATGRMKQADADHEIAAMEAVIETVKAAERAVVTLHHLNLYLDGLPKPEKYKAVPA